MSLIIRPYQEGDRAAWDEYVAAHSAGTPFHLIAWQRSMQISFGFRPCYWLAEDDGAIRGVLPLFLIENFLQGRLLLSSPFAVYGGILAESEEVQQRIAERVKQQGEELNVKHIELRNGSPSQCVGWERIRRYAGFKQRLEPQDAEKLLTSLPKKTRNMIRKSLKNEYSVQPAATLDQFEGLMLQNYRRHGTPAFPRRHFETIRAEFGPLVDVREIVLEGRVVAASMNFLFRGEMHTYYAASDPNYLAQAPNNFLYYDHILWAGGNGFTTFDFGRSKYDTGPYEFKHHWLAEEVELPYEILLVRGTERPDFTPKNSKFQLAIQIWRKMPIGLTRILGPLIVRLFP